MQGNRGRDTSPELRLRSLLHAMGLRYRVDARPIPDMNRRADIVFRRERVAVFVHGCFWHGCPQHYVAPKANAAYWSTKVEANRSRDTETNQRLEGAGWAVLTIWEHADLDAASREIERTVRSRR